MIAVIVGQCLERVGGEWGSERGEGGEGKRETQREKWRKGR